MEENSGDLALAGGARFRTRYAQPARPGLRGDRDRETRLMIDTMRGSAAYRCAPAAGGLVAAVGRWRRRAGQWFDRSAAISISATATERARLSGRLRPIYEPPAPLPVHSSSARLGILVEAISTTGTTSQRAGTQLDTHLGSATRMWWYATMHVGENTFNRRRMVWPSQLLALPQPRAHRFGLQRRPHDLPSVNRSLQGRRRARLISGRVTARVSTISLRHGAQAAAQKATKSPNIETRYATARHTDIAAKPHRGAICGLSL